MITIKDIQSNDKLDYINLAKSFYRSDAVLHSIPTQNFSNTFEYILNDKTYSEIFMIKEYTQNIGYLLIAKTYSQEAGGMVLLIEELYIQSDYRNKGIGKKIFEFLDIRYKEYKRFRLELTENNERAKKLYEKIGFEQLIYSQMIKEKGN